MEASPVIDLAALLPSVSLPSQLQLQPRPVSNLPESDGQNQEFPAILQNLTALAPEETLPSTEHLLSQPTAPLAENAIKQTDLHRPALQEAIVKVPEQEQEQNVEQKIQPETPRSPERVRPERPAEFVIGNKSLAQSMAVPPAPDSERVMERTVEGLQKSPELLTQKMVQSPEARVMARMMESPVENSPEPVKPQTPQEWLTKPVSKDIQSLKPEWVPQQNLTSHAVLNQPVSVMASQAPDIKPVSVDVAVNQTSQPSPHMNEPQPMRLKDFQEFPQSMSERLSWMVNREQKVANIRLDPPELGKLQVQLKVDGDQVSVQFQTSGNAVRDLILQQVDRLRMAMSASDMQLVDVNVSTSDQSHKQGSRTPSAESSVSTFMVDESTDDSGGLIQAKASLYGSGLLDTFA